MINPELRFFPNMATYSNDAPYCLLPSSKNYGSLITSFGENGPKIPNFDT